MRSLICRCSTHALVIRSLRTGPDPIDLGEAGGLLVDDLQGLHAEVPDEPFSHHLAEAVHEARAEVLLDCRDIEQGRATGEKALHSFLIRESYSHGRRIEPINVASRKTGEPVELHFITEEIPLPIDGRKIVCDVLALRRDGGRSTPVLLELKDDLILARLVEQVEGYPRS